MQDEPWIQTASGKRFPLLHPDIAAIDIEDIAHGLSLICRFTGQCDRFYSVAEHSVHVSLAINPEYGLWGLLHDGTEAYLGDMASPLKKALPEYKRIENRLMEAIATRFSLGPKPDSVKTADSKLLRVERRALMTPSPAPWKDDDKDLGDLPNVTIHGWSPQMAKAAFLARFEELGGK